MFSIPMTLRNSLIPVLPYDGCVFVYSRSKHIIYCSTIHFNANL